MPLRLTVEDDRVGAMRPVSSRAPASALDRSAIFPGASEELESVVSSRHRMTVVATIDTVIRWWEQR